MEWIRRRQRAGGVRMHMWGHKNMWTPPPPFDRWHIFKCYVKMRRRSLHILWNVCFSRRCSRLDFVIVGLAWKCSMFFDFSYLWVESALPVDEWRRKWITPEMYGNFNEFVCIYNIKTICDSVIWRQLVPQPPRGLMMTRSVESGIPPPPNMLGIWIIKEKISRRT